MFQLPQTTLGLLHLQILQGWQNYVNLAPDYTQQVDRAQARFSQYNVRENSTFTHIKSKLDEMCCGARRCAYCEDSMADEVEHIFPKSLYPDAVFDWNNYVYACGPCNGPKGNHFAVHLTGSGRCRNVTRRRNASIIPPPLGTPLLINPRQEDPMDFLFLDLSGTFLMLPKANLSFKDRQRARYTIHILKLNARDKLIDSRKNACRNYLARLREYIHERNLGNNVASYFTEFRLMDHRTVWMEMKRQRANHARLRSLFGEAPEAIHW